MPEMTGFELVRHVKKEHPEIGIIIMSSFEINKSEFDKVSPSSKIDAIIKKPVSFHRFIDTVDALMTRKPSQADD
jgi:YesN/AraC family two-component response regulator